LKKISAQKKDNQKMKKQHTETPDQWGYFQTYALITASAEAELDGKVSSSTYRPGHLWASVRAPKNEGSQKFILEPKLPAK
jgi:hypothetical protein